MLVVNFKGMYQPVHLHSLAKYNTRCSLQFYLLHQNLLNSITFCLILTLTSCYFVSSDKTFISRDWFISYSKFLEKSFVEVLITGSEIYKKKLLTFVMLKL